MVDKMVKRSDNLTIDSTGFMAYSEEIDDIKNKAENESKMGFFKCLSDLDLENNKMYPINTAFRILRFNHCEPFKSITVQFGI